MSPKATDLKKQRLQEAWQVEDKTGKGASEKLTPLRFRSAIWIHRIKKEGRKTAWRLVLGGLNHTTTNWLHPQEPLEGKDDFVYRWAQFLPDLLFSYKRKCLRMIHVKSFILQLSKIEDIYSSF